MSLRKRIINGAAILTLSSMLTPVLAASQEEINSLVSRLKDKGTKFIDEDDGEKATAYVEVHNNVNFLGTNYDGVAIYYYELDSGKKKIVTVLTKNTKDGLFVHSIMDYDNKLGEPDWVVSKTFKPQEKTETPIEVDMSKYRDEYKRPDEKNKKLYDSIITYRRFSL